MFGITKLTKVLMPPGNAVCTAIVIIRRYHFICPPSICPLPVVFQRSEIWWWGPNCAAGAKILSIFGEWGILRGFCTFGGSIFGLSGIGPPSAPLVFADLRQEGGTDEVISPDY